ncbi:hypothetical protein SAMN02910417_01951 [Eubacterium oxidoreducens]|uniref:Uncharacterized protein n=1 Tax=Eubacterium oxidoreducens TaxID=1732 RepID=A0A1G6C0W3_EUBOX|nr:hypothetical protein SAMN02910417_01951 [Eubacterium oxidoreducens]
MAITIVSIYLLALAIVLVAICFIGGKKNNLQDMHEEDQD